VKEIEFNLNKATAKGLQTITTTEDREDVGAGAGRTRSGSLTANSSGEQHLLKREVSEMSGARVDGRTPGSLGKIGGVDSSAVDENVFGRRRSSSITQRAEAEAGSNNYLRPACLKIVGTVDGYGLGTPEWWL
jgi:hypothetical protein